MNGAQIGVLKQPDKVRLGGLLQRRDSRALEPEISLEILRDLPHQSLERQLPDQQLGNLLVLPDLTKSNGAGPEAVWLLDSTSGRGRIGEGLCREGLCRGGKIELN